jgi:transposase InsO family protein
MSDDESNVSSASSSKVTMLTPSNYHVWAPEAEHRLMTLGLLRFVENGKAERPLPLLSGTTTDDGKGIKLEPSSSSSSSLSWETLEKQRKAQEVWEEKDEKAKASLLNSIRKDLRTIVTKGMTAKELWDALAVKYGTQSLTDSEFTFHSMISKRYQDGESMTTHVNFLRNSNLQLTNTDFHQSDKLMMYHLLKSLPPTWEPVRMTLRTSSAAGALLDFDRMATMLQEQASQMKRETQSGTAANPLVLAHPQSGKAGGKQQSGRGKSEGPPHLCSRHGKNWTHDTADCRTLQAAAGKQPTKSATGNKPVAALITSPLGPESDEERDEEGHCVLTVDENGNEATLPTESALSVLPPSVNGVSPSTVGGTYPVIADTGASCHLWKEDASTLTHYMPIENRFVVTGSGQRHRIVGMGSLRGTTPCNDSRVTTELHRVCHVPTLAFNLISLGRLDDDGYKSTQFRGTSTTVDKRGQTVLIAKKTGTGQVYTTFFTVSPSASSPPTATASIALIAAEKKETTESALTEMTKWHYRLCHMSPTSILPMFEKEAVSGIDCKAIARKLSLGSIPHTVDCTACEIGKSKRKPFTRLSERASRCLQRIHSDVCGPVRVKGRNGEIYFLTISDDWSRYGFAAVTALKDAKTIGSIIRDWILWAENQHSDKGYRVQTLRCDNGGEFVNDFLGPWLRSKGIEQELTTPHTPQLNGVAERLNLTLMDKVRTILTHSGAPEMFWTDCLLSVIHVHNRTTHKSLPDNITPYQRWFGKPPNVDGLRPFGCICYVHVPKTTARGKLDPRATVGMMLGYSSSGNGYKVWDIYNTSKKVKLIESRDCDFREWQYYGMLPVTGGRGGGIRALDSTSSTNSTNAIQNDSDENSDPTEENDAPPEGDVQTAPSPPVNNREDRLNVDQQPSDQKDAATEPTDSEPDGSGINSTVADVGGRRLKGRELSALQDFMSSGSRDNAPSTLGSKMAARQTPLNPPDVAHTVQTITPLAMAMTELSADEPRSYKEAMAGQNAEKWNGGCIKEIQQLKHNKTWVLVEPPPDTNIVGCRWILKLKAMPDGSVKYKARLVAQGFTQRPGVDFDETYSPVVRFASLRALFSLAAHYDWEVHHMDVKSAYLNGTLEETIYMRQPEGFEEKGKEQFVCLLKKGLYGLKQAGRCWNHTIDPALQKLGLIPSDKDNCVYFHRSNNEMIIICLYVDDLFLFTASSRLLKQFKQGLKAKFEMEDLGEARLVLGMQIIRDRANRTLTISQQAYLEKLIEKLGLMNMNALSTPMIPNAVLVKAPSNHTASPQDISWYQSVIGSLMYVSNGTRPDIAFTVNRLSKYSSNPDATHISALKHLLRYVRGTLSYCLTYTGTEDQQPPLIAYCDADYANDKDDRLSISGYAVMLCGGAISWAARRQSVIADSTSTAEYIAIAEATKDIMWWRPLLMQLGYKISAPTALLNDNQGSIFLAHNGDNSTRSKAIDVKYHLIRQELRNRTIDLSYVATQHNVADLLTKGLARNRHRLLTAALGVTRA